MDDSSTVSFRIAVATDEDAKAVVADLQALDVARSEIDVDPGGAGFVDPLTGAVVAAVVVATVTQLGKFAAFLVNWWERRNKPGMIIDCRGDTVQLIETNAVPYGQVITLTADGQTIKHIDADGGESIADYVEKVLADLPAPGGAPKPAQTPPST